ncbi:MAG: hypothetical protein CHACPFDD_03958 [Phycisphaerae bacterium]|nr:hypothetical protein [Phycisphaerae bacterium]
MRVTDDAARSARYLTRAAALTAIAMFVASGLAYRSLAAMLKSDSAAAIAPGTLQRLPLEIGGWRGVEVPLDKDVIRRTDTDDHLNRHYRRGLEGVALFIGAGGRPRDLMPHRPEICYTSVGWTLLETEFVELPLAAGKLNCRLLTFRRAGLGGERVVVLNYYIVDGRYSADSTLLRSKAPTFLSGMKCMAQVQINCRVDGLSNEAAARQTVIDFARATADAIRELLPDGGLTAPPHGEEQE